MMQCWQTEPGDRPSFTQLHQQLSLWCDTLVIGEVILTFSSTVGVRCF